MAVSYCGDEIKYEALKTFLNIPDKEIYFNITKYIRDNNPKEILCYFNQLNEQGFDMQTFYNGITEHLRNLMIVQSTQNIDLLDEPDSIKSKYNEEAGQLSSEQVSRLLKILFEAENRFKYSSNQKILLESILVELTRVNAEVINLSDIISEIEGVKKKILSEKNYPENTATSPDEKQPPIREKIRDTVASDNSNKTSGSDSIHNISSKENEIIEKLKEFFDVEEYKINQGFDEV
jgi:DNA polymerase-3 subunit gamma/tau